MEPFTESEMNQRFVIQAYLGSVEAVPVGRNFPIRQHSIP